MQERDLKLTSGWAMAFISLLTPFLVVGLCFTQNPFVIAAAVVIGVVWLVGLCGFIVVNPNEARVVQLFGTYVGTISETGFYWGNPFYRATRVSQRVRTFETGLHETPEKKDAAGNVTAPAQRSKQSSKVNDRDGTPIEIGAVVTWKVTTPAQAVFEVDNYENFVQVQADAALRSLASQYSYDSPDDQAHSLRGNTAEVAERLKTEIEARVKPAGVDILEARISTLAYAPEIASAMLQRQQAGAIIAARQKIVEGAVGMVEHALEMLAAKNVIDLDGDRRAAMVSNLLVVLCGHGAPQPVINTGTLYQ